MPEPIKTFHPTLEKTKKLFILRGQLENIATMKSLGLLSPADASQLAFDAVVKANGGMPNATSGPMVRLCKLCNNGWIREAANEMSVVYPDLDSPERWGKRRSHGRKTQSI